MAQLETQNISPAFMRPPSTAEMFRQSYAASDAAQAAGVAQENAQPQPAPVQQQPQPQPQPQPQQIIVPAPRKGNPIMPETRSSQAPLQPQAAQPPQAGEQSGGTASPPVASQTAPISSDNATLQRQLEAERRAWAQKEAQWQAAYQQQQETLNQYGQMAQEYNALKKQAELNQQLSNDELFSGMSSVDAEDARRIISVTAQTLQQPLDNMQAQLQRQQQQLAQQQQYIDQQVYRMQQAKASQELQAAHPDFAQLVNDPAFIQFAQQRDGYTSRSREQTAWEEFNRGNSAYVINMVNEFKGVKPTTSTIQSAPPVQVASSAVSPQAQPQAAPRYTLGELNNLMQMRQITPDQYRVLLNEYREFQHAQPPQ